MGQPVAKVLGYGTLYDFAEPGDVLPMHDHDETTAHDTLVARGGLRVSGPGWERLLAPGDFVKFKPGNPHELQATERNTRILNILNGGV
jgi:quercetin dioxygenase-like cupin family protein